jgi:small-conductance mechanosensitive channel
MLQFAGLDALAPLASRIAAAVGPALVFLAALFAVYLPGHYLLVPAARRLMDAVGVDDTIELPFLKVLDVGFLLFGLFVAATLSELASFLAATEAITAAATIAIGFASQDVLGNLVSGVFIVLDPTYNIGDWIQWNDKEGIIEDISFRTTRVHTFDNELVSVPNSELTTNAITNPVAKDRLRVPAEFGIGYGDDIDGVREILLSAADDHPEILDRPAPSIRLTDLGESAVGLTVRFWIDDPQRTDFVRIRSEFTQSVKERFDAAGVEMPYPYRQLTGSVETREGQPAATPSGD